MRVFPSLRVWTSRAHANAVERRGKYKVAVATLFLGNQGGEGLVDRLGEVTRQLTRLPDDGEDLAALIVQRGELPGMDAIVRRGLVSRVSGACLSDLFRCQSGQGRALGDRDVPPKGVSGRAAPELLTLLHNFIKVGLGVKASAATDLGGLVGDPRLRPFDPLVGLAATPRNGVA